MWTIAIQFFSQMCVKPKDSLTSRSCPDWLHRFAFVLHGCETVIFMFSSECVIKLPSTVGWIYRRLGVFIWALYAHLCVVRSRPWLTYIHLCIAYVFMTSFTNVLHNITYHMASLVYNTMSMHFCKLNFSLASILWQIL